MWTTRFATRPAGYVLAFGLLVGPGVGGIPPEDAALRGVLGTSTPVTAWQAQSEEEQAYQSATQAIEAQRWEAAVQDLQRVVALEGRRAAAGRYWTAYAQNRLGRSAAALETLAELRRRHPESAWIDDAEALELEIRQAAGQRVEPRDVADDELKLMVLNGLMHNDSEEAVPLVLEVLEGSHSRAVKERALFVLGQSDAPTAREAMARLARDGSDTELQAHAVRMLGLHGGEEALWRLYQDEGATEVREHILHALFLADATERVFDLARNEDDSELRLQAVHWLGLMDAVDRLRELYEREQDVEVRSRILHSYFLADAVEPLVQVARQDASAELRRDAVHRLGLIDSEEAGRVLVDLHADEPDPEVRSRIVHALWLQENAAALIEIYGQESDLEVRKQIVHWLGMLDDSPEAMAFLRSLLIEGES